MSKISHFWCKMGGGHVSFVAKILPADFKSIGTPWRQNAYKSAPRCPDIIKKSASTMNRHLTSFGTREYYKRLLNLPSPTRTQTPVFVPSPLIDTRRTVYQSVSQLIACRRDDLTVLYRRNSNNRPMCYVVGVASSGKVWCFFVFKSLRGAEQLTPLSQSREFPTT